jgi:hypothetical protein
MADLTVTPANVVPGSNASTMQGTAGETITAGKAVYLSPTTKKWMLADSDSVTTAARDAVAVALTGSSLNQPIVVQKGGDVNPGATMIAGVSYYVSNTAGGICPDADVGTGEEVVLVGIATTTTNLALQFKSSGVVR